MSQQPGTRRKGWAYFLYFSKNKSVILGHQVHWVVSSPFSPAASSSEVSQQPSDMSKIESRLFCFHFFLHKLNTSFCPSAQCDPSATLPHLLAAMDPSLFLFHCPILIPPSILPSLSFHPFVALSIPTSSQPTQAHNNYTFFINKKPVD